MYLDHLKFCVVCINYMSVVVNVMLSLMSVMSPPPALCNLSARTVVKLWCVCFRDELGYLNCEAICMCVVNKKYELFEFVFDSVYVDLHNDQISLPFTDGSVSLCCVCSHVVVFGLSVSLSWYPVWMRWLR